MVYLVNLFHYFAHTHTQKEKLSMSWCLWLTVFPPASSGGWPSPTSCPSIHLASPGGLCAEASHFSGVCTLRFRCCPSIGARSRGEVCLYPSPRLRELGSTDSCIKDKAVQGKCSRSATAATVTALSQRVQHRLKWIISFKRLGLLRWYLAPLMLWREYLSWGWSEAPGCRSSMGEWPLRTGTSLAPWSCLDAWTGYETDPGGLMSAAGSSTVSVCGLTERIRGGMLINLITKMHCSLALY